MRGEEQEQRSGPPSGQAHLRLRQAEGGGQLHPLGRGQVALDLESLLQARQLRVREHRARFAAAAVLPRQLRVRRVREQRRDRHPCREKSRPVGRTPSRASNPRSTPLLWPGQLPQPLVATSPLLAPKPLESRPFSGHEGRAGGGGDNKNTAWRSSGSHLETQTINSRKNGKEHYKIDRKTF